MRRISADGRPEVLAATLPALAQGSYLAGWRIVSADDGHVEAGSLAFAIGTGSGAVTSPAPAASHPLAGGRPLAGDGPGCCCWSGSSPPP